LFDCPVRFGSFFKGIGRKTDFYSLGRWLQLEAPEKKASRCSFLDRELQHFVVRRDLSFKLQEKRKLKMKLQQVLLFRRRAPRLCGPKGFPTRFELTCSKRARFERFLHCCWAGDWTFALEIVVQCWDWTDDFTFMMHVGFVV